TLHGTWPSAAASGFYQLPVPDNRYHDHHVRFFLVVRLLLAPSFHEVQSSSDEATCLRFVSCSQIIFLFFQSLSQHSKLILVII
uniref:Uncharacterized protein n=1 Tax=Ciona intestinalis TaxID=7719 RepID=F6Y3R6_CIOIN